MIYSFSLAWLLIDYRLDYLNSKERIFFSRSLIYNSVLLNVCSFFALILLFVTK